MAAPIKFNGLTYNEFRPIFKGKPENRFTMPKGLPALPATIPVATAGNIPFTEKMIDLDKVRNLQPGITGKGFLAVLIDSGVFEHELLTGNIHSRFSTNGTESDINDLYGHGTHMAGIIAAKNSKISSIGIAPKAGIISIKVTKGNSGSASWKSIYMALQHTLELAQNESNQERKIGVVNISFNGLDAQTDDSKICKHKISQIINKLAQLNIPVVVSAGNAFAYKTQDGLGYPAFHDTVIAAGAHNNYNFKYFPIQSISPYSQRYRKSGSQIVGLVTKKPNTKLMFAPGLCSVSLNNSNAADKRFSVTSGTSVAAAVISGTILLMQEKWNVKNQGRMPLSMLKEKLKSGCEVFQNVNYSSFAAGVTGVATRAYDYKNYIRINIFKTLNLI